MSPYADSQDPGGTNSVVNSSTENVDNNVLNGINLTVKHAMLPPFVNTNTSSTTIVQSPNSSTTPPPPQQAANASGVNFNGATVISNSASGINILNSGNSIIINSSSSSSSSNNNNGNGSIPSPSGTPSSSSTTSINTSSNGINYAAPPLSDIDQYLMAFPSDLPELVVAACWWAESLGKLNMNIPKDNIKRFRKELLLGLRNRINGHWYPDYPERGQGYRAIICEETTDRLLMDAAKKSDIVGEFRQLVKQNTTMWIDPGNVTYRHGKHYEKVLYPFNFSSNPSLNIPNQNNNIYTNNHHQHHHQINTLNNSNNGLNGSGNNVYQPSSSSLSSSSPSYATPNTPTRSLNPNVVNSSPSSQSNINGLNGGNNNTGGRGVSSPSLSSASLSFSPSSSMYQHIHHHSPSISPPASPAKDINGIINNNNTNNNSTNVYSQNNFFYQNHQTNSSKIKLYSP